MATVKAELQERPLTDADDDLDNMPLIQRKKMLLAGKASSAAQPLPSSAGPVDMSVKRVSTGAFREWPGLPRGVKFDPSDEELLWHLLAKVGKGEAEPHPFISEFIISLDVDDRFGYTHPQKLPGVKQDGSLSYFFHRAFKALNTLNQKHRKTQKNDCDDVCWHMIGKTKPVFLNGIHQGCKKIMVFYMKIDEKPEKTNWVMHQYHLGRGAEGEGNFVASKIFYHQDSGKSDKNAQDFHPEDVVTVGIAADSATGHTLVWPETHAESQRIEDSAQDEDHGRQFQPKVCSNSKEDASQSVIAKAEPDEEIFINKSLEPTAEKIQCINTRPGSVLPTYAEIKAELLDDSCNNIFHEYIAAELQIVPPSSNPRESSFALADCSGDKKVQEDVSTEFSLSEKAYFTKDVYMRSNAPEQHLSTTILGSGCSSKDVQFDCMNEQHISMENCCKSPSRFIGSNALVAELKGELHGELIADEIDHIPLKERLEMPVELSSSSLGNGNIRKHSRKTPKHYSSSGSIVSQDSKANCYSVRKKRRKKRKRTVKYVSIMIEQHISMENCCKSPSRFIGSNALVAELKGELHDELIADEIDHIPLKERLEMPVELSSSSLGNGNIRKHSRKTPKHYSSSGSIVSQDSKANCYSVRKKRKKTVTDSVETALEEDAPGLLQVLLDKGITIEEIKLYGEMEDDEALEISSTDNNFEDLENVITKLFLKRSSLPKLSLGRQVNGSKVDYCLACLISLIEQARYSLFRDSPVEWGWCRDLQSFIFVFKKHNRIVLERPEYGYATYFFELVELLPIDWQIKRLVTTMKLSSCSRTTLIENRSLVVGEDLTEGEARVLEGYGWVPDTGLGMMLNYCDRVFHDLRTERVISDWRTKIGKMLMAGHDGGRTVVTNPPNKAVEYMAGDYPSIKLEV